MAAAMIGPKFYAWDRNGKPLAFGKLYTYQARTNTPKPTYQSEDQVVENTNPVILNGEGYANVYLDGSYKMVLKDDKDNEIWTSDPVTSAQAEEWVNCLPAEYASPTSFKVAGNVTGTYTEDRIIRINNGGSGYSFDVISSSSFAGGFTTVITNGASVQTGIISVCTAITSADSSVTYTDIGEYSDYSFNTVDGMISAEKNGRKITYKDGMIISVGGRRNVFDSGGCRYFVAPGGTVTDGENGQHLNYSYFEVQGFQLIYIPDGYEANAVSFNVVADGVEDDTEALNNFFDYCRYGSPIDGLPKGRIKPRLPFRGKIKKTGTLNLIDFLVEVDFGNCEILQFDAQDSIYWEGNLANLGNYIIRYDESVDPQDIISNEVYGIRISGGQPVAITSESVFSEIKQGWVFGAFRGVGLKSYGADGGLFWQFILRQSYCVNCYDYAYYFESVVQVSTTTTIQNCHVGAKVSNAVTKGVSTYVSKQHHVSTAFNEPGVGVSWEDYWVLDNSASGVVGEWKSGEFYRTHGKGYNINNVQTCILTNNSMDGGNNFQSGNVIKAINSFVEIDTFHLEGHNMYREDVAPIEIGSDANIGWIYLFDLRVRLPNSSDTAPLVSGTLNRNRNLVMEGVRNHNQNASSNGTLLHFDGSRQNNAFNSVRLGPGVSVYQGLPQKSEALRGLPSRPHNVGNVPSGTNPTITFDGAENGAIYDANTSGVLTINMFNGVEIGSSFMAVNRGAGKITLTPTGTSVIVGPTSAPSGKLIQGIKLTAATWKTWLEQ